MKISQKIKINWILLKRSSLFWIVSLFNYIVLAFLDNKSGVLLYSYEASIYRYTVQQIFIVITSIFLIQQLFNEKMLNTAKNYMVIYTHKITDDIYAVLAVNCLTNILFFFAGQLLLFTINIICIHQMQIRLWVVNLIIVSLEIVISQLLVMGLRLLFKKDILVFGMYFLLIITSLVINNVFICFPLTIHIVGFGSLEYYITFGKELWLGRILLLLLAGITFKAGITKLKISYKKEL